MIGNIRSCAIRWQIPEFLSDGNVCIASVYVSKYSPEKFDHENGDQVHGVQHSL